MGCDGAIGAKHLKDAGASVVVQEVLEVSQKLQI